MGGATNCQKQADQPYEESYGHVVAPDNGEGARCDPCMLVRRPTRDFSGPVVHYGVIASSTFELTRGTVRDWAKPELGGPLCFDSEATSLINSFPCLVIRGIADYVDLNRCQCWHRYAATTAAACAKELLEILLPRELERMDKIANIPHGGMFPVLFQKKV
jgi:hypothetical protein